MSLNDKYISFATVFIALIALIVSMKSCQQSEQALQLQTKEHINAITTVWKSEVQKEKDLIKIIPTNDKITLQKAIVHFPDKISNNHWPVESPDYMLHLIYYKSTIQQFIESRIPKKKGSVAILDSSIPIIIDSQYIVNGQLYSDRALYALEINAIVWSEEYKAPSITYNGISFIRRLDETEYPKILLNNLLNTVSKNMQKDKN